MLPIKWILKVKKKDKYSLCKATDFFKNKDYFIHLYATISMPFLVSL